MNNFKLLDCTLRDGGYVNDWKFGHNTLINVFERVTSAGIDFIEVGFLDQRCDFDINRSIMPTTECMSKIYGELDSKKTQVVGMIDYGTCELNNIQPCKDSFLDGIRVIFKKHLRVEALEYCKRIKELGYKVFTQAVSITSYTDEELLDLIKLVNVVKPYAVSIVDTYGLLHKNSLFHYYEMMNQYLDESIGIGYHSHNNFQLGYANCIELMNHHGDSSRELLCDGSVFGMGKGAGNAPTELLAMYMNENYDKHYDISQLLEAIDVNILDIYKHASWGYSMKFFIAASNDCHPNYVSYLLNKKTLSVKSVNEILRNLEEDKKLLYDKKYIEQLYIDYQKYACDDSVAYRELSSQMKEKDILVLGPGRSVKDEEKTITEYISRNNPLVISINFLPERWAIDYLFLTNSKRYVQQATSISQLSERTKIIATSNVTKSNGEFDYNMDYESLIDRNAVFMDNSFIMLLKVLIKVGVARVALAGFDGYSSDRETNYYSSKMEYEFAKQKGDEINAYVDRILPELRKQLTLNFITSTIYKG